MSKARKALLVSVLLVCSAATLCCASPERPQATDYPRIASHAISPTANTTLKTTIVPLMRANPNQSGFKLLTRGDESLLQRLSLIQSAQKTLDLQYYIMETDKTGKLVLQALLRAADRGVRVRLLMDDLNRSNADPVWTLFNTHRNIEIRVFNPFATRKQGLLSRMQEILSGFDRFTHRMHNKVLIADNQAAITGGRNLGDPYFDEGEEFNFRDVDVLAVGPIVPSLSSSFDKYWNDDESYPLSAVLEPHAKPEDVQAFRIELQENWQAEMKKDPPSLAQQLKQNKIPLIWAKSELAADLPSKIDMPEEMATSKPASYLERLANKAEQEFIIVSPYFVPQEEGGQYLRGMVKRGVKVRVLTNSLASIDVVAVHPGYSRYRQSLVEGGVELYETQPAPGPHPRSPKFSSSARDSLHSKVYVVDRKDVMIGSFNLDPRSINLNTEMLLIIHSPKLAQQVATMFERAVAPNSSYHLEVKDGRLIWVGVEDGKEVSYDSDPKVDLWRGIKSSVLGLLPMEDQL